jgi:hypothetical protein
MVAPEPEGGLFWLGDEYALAANYDDDIEQLGLNVIAEFCGAGGKRVAYSTATSFGSFFRTALSNAGHTVSAITVAANLTLANYDFAFLNNTLCSEAQIWSFVQSGGGVLIPLGTYNENDWFGTLFGYTGIVHPDQYVFGGLVTCNGGAPYFTGVTNIYMNGASVMSLTTPSAGGTNMLYSGTAGSTYNVFASWRP